ncbi:acyltransferase [Dickeya dianthicola]|uniref:Acyltransferase n=2 Tax=Dickeya dianthicola TaxID=204039 RepID=A0ABX9NV78_9GAMM|nr:acyltransferase [Dickeya dianthicola]MCI4068614.1 acyltransferase [Dickeya dianthicola]MCI4113147.1 acyltransferase [Dickeya dianthicola]MCI4119063.1 acyltransferase [Dickeya dianthicola]MCI4121569.1 acyltransferase [Dickeya dianthicola]MCI4188712.1 acyltransferase [Dickeya dianthicola]
MKIASIQYLRGLAALLVVVAHNSSLLGGNWTKHIPGALGVDVFFIISGFIMTFITYHTPDSPVAFIIKRFFRIWPVFFLVWLLSFIFVYNERSFSQMACTLYFCLQDYSQPGPTFGYSALGPPWTLSYEIMFYFIFAVSMCISYRHRSYICTLIFVAAMTGFQLYYNSSIDFSSQVSPNIIVMHWWQAWIKLISNTIVFEFITGMLLAEFIVRNRISKLLFSRILAKIIIAIAVAGAFIVGPQVFGLSGGFWLASVIMISVIILSDHNQTGYNRILTFFGDISYSLYIAHYPVMVFLKNHLSDSATSTEKMTIFMFSIAASIVIASVMFIWIETPSIRAGKKVAGILFVMMRRYQH